MCYNHSVGLYSINACMYVCACLWVYLLMVSVCCSVAVWLPVINPVCGILSLSLWVVSPRLLSVFNNVWLSSGLLGTFAKFRVFIFSVIPSVMIFFLPVEVLFVRLQFIPHLCQWPLRKDHSVLKGSFSRSTLFSFLSDQTPPLLQSLCTPPDICCWILTCHFVCLQPPGHLSDHLSLSLYYSQFLGPFFCLSCV